MQVELEVTGAAMLGEEPRIPSGNGLQGRPGSGLAEQRAAEGMNTELACFQLMSQVCELALHCGSWAKHSGRPWPLILA